MDEIKANGEQEDESFGLENLHLEIPFDRVGTFKRQFLKRLEDFSENNKYENSNVKVIERRLDSLARLLESDLTCVAVRLDTTSEVLYISSNQNMDHDIIQNLFSTLQNEINDDTNKLLTNLISKKLYKTFSQYEWREESKQEKAALKLTLEGVVSTFIEKALKYRNMVSIMELLDSDMVELPSKDFFDEKISKKVLVSTLRLLRDFLKLNYIFSNDSIEELNILFNAISNVDTYVLTQDMEKKELEGLHAEIQAMHGWLGLNELDELNCYIGISKLSCGHCALYISALRELDYDIKHRGNHGTVKGMWQLSKFLKENQDMFKIFVGEQAYTTFYDMSVKQKEQCYDFIMKVGSTHYTKDDRNDIRGEIKPSPIKTLIKIPPNKKTAPLDADFSDSDEEAYEKLYDFNYRIKNGTKEPLELLQFKEMSRSMDDKDLKLIKEFFRKHNLQCEDWAFDSIYQIYKLNLNEFWKLIDDDQELIENIGFSEACDQLLQRLKQNILTQNDEDSDYEDKHQHSAYLELKEEIDEDHGWDYAYNPDDSENEWVYDLMGN